MTFVEKADNYTYKYWIENRKIVAISKEEKKTISYKDKDIEIYG